MTGDQIISAGLDGGPLTFAWEEPCAPPCVASKGLPLAASDGPALASVENPKPEVEPFQAAIEAFQAVQEVETLQEAPEVEAFKDAPRWAPCVKFSLWGPGSWISGVGSVGLVTDALPAMNKNFGFFNSFIKRDE